MSKRYVALLRGINVGGRNKLPMKDLVSIFEAVGCADVRTYIQSGNVVFDADAATAKRVAAAVSDAIAAKLSLRAPVIQRDAKAFESVVAKHPLISRGADPATLFVMFLADRPKAVDVKRLDPDRSPGDAFVVTGREIYISCPNGAARSKLTNDYFDRALGTISTTRNWRTCLRLAEMLGA
ncbi:MAG TPA: DUF1697 domain-containing protein [Phycisphaerae bacterium]|nr:DUF1697 domain-containing protein [Phycisphaerae bacterium]HRW54361.1 DUF1697 domain-containing protein [Phycisphaerae bacterium]